eukprot:jgi/Bigna1/86554/estExt_fgenesh1_pg.C_110194
MGRPGRPRKRFIRVVALLASTLFPMLVVLRREDEQRSPSRHGDGSRHYHFQGIGNHHEHSTLLKGDGMEAIDRLKDVQHGFLVGGCEGRRIELAVPKLRHYSIQSWGLLRLPTITFRVYEEEQCSSVLACVYNFLSVFIFENSIGRRHKRNKIGGKLRSSCRSCSPGTSSSTEDDDEFSAISDDEEYGNDEFSVPSVDTDERQSSKWSKKNKKKRPAMKDLEIRDDGDEEEEVVEGVECEASEKKNSSVEKKDGEQRHCKRQSLNSRRGAAGSEGGGGKEGIGGLAHQADAPATNQSGANMRNKEKDEKGRKRDIVVQWSHPGTVNRIRADPRNPNIIATMSDNGFVYIWNASVAVKMLEGDKDDGRGDDEHDTSSQNARPLVKSKFDRRGAMFREMKLRPRFKYGGHGAEGYALAWSPHYRQGGGGSSAVQKDYDEGEKLRSFALLTGDTNGVVKLWQQLDSAPPLSSQTSSSLPPSSSSPWKILDAEFLHPGSVEDICWSPVEPGVFATACVDGKVRIWAATDACHPPSSLATAAANANSQQRRSRGGGKDPFKNKNNPKPKIIFKAHDADVNVMAWNTKSTCAHLLATGADDGTFKVWDLRELLVGDDDNDNDGDDEGKNGEGERKDTKSSLESSPTPIASVSYHIGHPITSIAWHPDEESVLVVSSADNRVTVWDFSLEADDDNDDDCMEDIQGVNKIPSKNRKKKKEKQQQPRQPQQPDIPVSLYFVHQGMNEVKEVAFDPDIVGRIIATAESGFNIFHPINL